MKVICVMSLQTGYADANEQDSTNGIVSNEL